MYIGKYKIIKELGSGAMGKVYLGEDSQLGKLYAIKTAIQTPDGKYVEALKHECHIMKNLSERFIPYVVDVGQDGDITYMVMEYIEGENLQDYLSKHAPLSPDRAVDYIKKITDIISYLHSQNPGIIFRDLKPSNLIIGNNDNIRLLDFGAGIEAYHMTDSLYIMGTYGYAAPEVLEGKNIGRSSDIYSLGAILYFMLTGIDPALPPYKIEDIQEADITVGDSLCKLVNDMTNPSVSKRISTCQVLEDRIKDLKDCSKARKLYRDYLVFYPASILGIVYSSYYIWLSYVKECILYNKLYISLAILLGLILIKRTLDRQYDNRHFIRKRRINLIYTEKRVVFFPRH